MLGINGLQSASHFFFEIFLLKEGMDNIDRKICNLID